MATAPYLVADGEELRLNAAVGGTRRDLVLSDRATALLREDLGYGPTDFVPFVTAKALVLAGGARVPGGRDARDAAWRLSGADGGRDASDDECYRVAEYLRGVEVPERAVETLHEHVRSTCLSRFLNDDEIASTGDRVGDLSDLARDL